MTEYALTSTRSGNRPSTRIFEVHRDSDGGSSRSGNHVRQCGPEPLPDVPGRPATAPGRSPGRGPSARTGGSRQHPPAPIRHLYPRSDPLAPCYTYSRAKATIHKNVTRRIHTNVTRREARWPDPALTRPPVAWATMHPDHKRGSRREGGHDNRIGAAWNGGRTHARRRPRGDLVSAHRRRTSLRHRLRSRVAVRLRRRGTRLLPSGGRVPHPPSCRPHR